MNFRDKIVIDGYFYSMLKNNKNKYKIVINMLGLKSKFSNTPEEIDYINNLISEESSVLNWLDSMTTQPDILKDLLLQDFNFTDLETFHNIVPDYIEVITDILEEYSLESLTLDRDSTPIKLSNICSYIENSTQGIKSDEEITYFKFMVSYLLHNPNLPEEFKPLALLYSTPNLKYESIPITENLIERNWANSLLLRLEWEATEADLAKEYLKEFLEEVYVCAECCIGSNSYEKSLLSIKEEDIIENKTSKSYTVVKSSKSGGNEVAVKTFDDRIKAEEHISELTKNYPRVVEMFDLSIRED